MSLKKLSNEDIEIWPEVFKYVQPNSIPIKYISNIQFTFKDKRVWQIKIGSELKSENWQFIERNIYELMLNYKENLDSINFQINANKVKSDISKVTSKFLRRKLK